MSTIIVIWMTITLFSDFAHFTLLKIYIRLYYVIFQNNLVSKFISSKAKTKTYKYFLYTI